jgi:hypothetical protein
VDIWRTIAIPSPFLINRTILLLLQRTRVIHVVTAVINRRGETTMTTLTTEEQSTLAASGAAQEPKATTKANVAPRKPRVAPSKGKSLKTHLKIVGAHCIPPWTRKRPTELLAGLK